MPFTGHADMHSLPLVAQLIPLRQSMRLTGTGPEFVNIKLIQAQGFEILTGAGVFRLLAKGGGNISENAIKWGIGH